MLCSLEGLGSQGGLGKSKAWHKGVMQWAHEPIGHGGVTGEPHSDTARLPSEELLVSEVHRGTGAECDICDLGTLAHSNQFLQLML